MAVIKTGLTRIMHRSRLITQNGGPKTVLQGPESFENMRNAIGILKLISQGEDDLKNGNIRTHEEIFANIERKLKKDEKIMGLFGPTQQKMIF